MKNDVMVVAQKQEYSMPELVEILNLDRRTVKKLIGALGVEPRIVKGKDGNSNQFIYDLEPSQLLLVQQQQQQDAKAIIAGDKAQKVVGELFDKKLGGMVVQKSIEKMDIGQIGMLGVMAFQAMVEKSTERQEEHNSIIAQLNEQFALLESKTEQLVVDHKTMKQSRAGYKSYSKRENKIVKGVQQVVKVKKQKDVVDAVKKMNDEKNFAMSEMQFLDDEKKRIEAENRELKFNKYMADAE